MCCLDGVGSCSLFTFINLTSYIYTFSLRYSIARRAPTIHCWTDQLHLFYKHKLLSKLPLSLQVEMALLSAEHLAGPGYIILNVLRGLNIIALSSVVASSVVMLVKTFIISKVSRLADVWVASKLTIASSSSSMPQVMLSPPSRDFSLSSPNALYSVTSTPATGRSSAHPTASSR